MGLITNGHRNGFSPFKWMNGNTLSIQNGCGRSNYLPGKLHNWQLHGERQTALPNGNLHPYSWMLPRVAGNMSMRPEGSGDLAADLIPTINGAIDFTGFGDLTAEAALVISMFCAMSGTGDLEATITGLLNMSIDLEGSGDLSSALSAFGNMAIDLEGSGDLEATIAAYGNMSIDIVVTGTGLTIENVGNAVWQYLAAQATDPTTMGGKMNSAGNAGDPWGTILPGTYTGEQAGKIVADMEDLIRKIKAITSANL